jgi:hypothetical protein
MTIRTASRNMALSGTLAVKQAGLSGRDVSAFEIEF